MAVKATNKRKGFVKISEIPHVKNSFQEYWLYFVKGQSKIQNWFCRGHGHIAILTKDKNQWYIIDPWPTHLKFEPLPFDIDRDLPFELIDFFNAKECIYMKINPKKIKKIKYKWWHFFIPRLISCVSIVQYILGTKLKGATPYGVVKNLRKNRKKFEKNEVEKINFLPNFKED